MLDTLFFVKSCNLMTENSDKTPAVDMITGYVARGFSWDHNNEDLEIGIRIV